MGGPRQINAVMGVGVFGETFGQNVDAVGRHENLNALVEGEGAVSTRELLKAMGQLPLKTGRLRTARGGGVSHGAPFGETKDGGRSDGPAPAGGPERYGGPVR